jgi:hypothetical protein
MHVLLVCIDYCDFVWYIYLILFMVAWIDGGEGSNVEAWREFISQVQVQVLFERILSGCSYKVDGAFGGETWEYFVVH